jgi:hypothetical protein
VCYKKSTFLAKFYQITILNTVLVFLEVANLAQILDPANDPRKIIKVFGVDMNIIKGKKNWYFSKPLLASGKQLAGSTHLAVKPDDNTIEKFNKYFKPMHPKPIQKPDNDGKSIEQFTDLIMRLKAGNYPNEHEWTSADFVKNGLLSSDAMVRKYLLLAEWAGLYDTAQDKISAKGEQQYKLQKPKGKPTPKSQKAADKLSKEFLDDIYNQRMWKKWTKMNTKTYRRPLFNALKILDTTPSDLVMKTGRNKDLSDEDKLDEFKKILLQLRHWSENPNAINPATNQPREIKDGIGSNTGNRFAPNAKVIAVKPESIDRVAADTNAPIETKPDKNKGLTLVSDRNNSTMYNMVKVLRHLWTSNSGVTVEDQPKIDSAAGEGESVLSQEAVGVGRYPEIKMSWEQILGMRECLEHGIEHDTKEVTITTKGAYTDITGKIDLTEFKHTWSIKSYWQDAYFLFMLAVGALGARAEELFDIIAGVPIGDGSGVEIDKKLDAYSVSIYTRKSEQTKAGKIHEAIIPNSPDGDIIKHLIDVRQAEIEKGNDILTKVKVDGEWVKNEIHALIGADDKYTNIRTINKPVDEVIEVPKRRQIIKNILRHCYEHVNVKEQKYYTFFFDRPIHSLRHVFAHYWLEKSGYNYNLVADLGHWHNLELLKGSYGKMNKKLFAHTLDAVANVDPSLTPIEMKLDRERKEKLYAKTPRVRMAIPKQPAFIERALKGYVDDKHKGKDTGEIKVKDDSQGAGAVEPVSKKASLGFSDTEPEPTPEPEPEPTPEPVPEQEK